jgi:hypothetical protein
MKHASPSALDTLEELLAALRAWPALEEKARGVFYLKARAFLHFHEDPAGLFADLRLAAEFKRFPVNTQSERRQLLRKVQDALGKAR